MGIYRGDAEYTDRLQLGAGPLWRCYNGGELVWPEYGELVGFDDDHRMFRIPPVNPAGAAVVADVGGEVNVLRGLIHHGGLLYGVKGDLIINPTQAEMWRIRQDGQHEQIGVFPNDGTADIDAAGALAYDPDEDEVYLVDRVSTSESRVFRCPGVAAGGAFDATLGASRLIFPNTQAHVATIAGNVHGATVIDGYVHFVDASGTVRRGRTGQSALTLSTVGSLPGAAPAMQGVDLMHGWVIGVADDDRLWRWPPMSPSAAVQIASTIPGVDGEIECLAYVPKASVARPGLSLANLSISGDTALAVRLQAGGLTRGNGQYNLWSGPGWTGDAQTGTLMNGSPTISGISGYAGELVRLAKWDRSSEDRLIINATTTTGTLGAALSGAYDLTVVVETSAGPQIFTLPQTRSGGTTWADWWRGGGHTSLTQAAWDLIDAVAPGDTLIVAIHTGTATYSSS